MEHEKLQSAAGQPPVVEEHTFSGALFGFRRKDVLDYVRTMSENNEAYIRTLDGSVAALQTELDASREAAQLLESRIAELTAAMEADAADDAKRQAEYERTMQEYRACREKLFGREQKYVQLQKEYRELRAQNDMIIQQMQKAKELLQQNQQELDAAAAREQQLKEEHARALEEAARAAQEASLLQAEEAAGKAAALQAQHEQAMQQLEEDKAREMQELGADADRIISRLGARADAEQERLARGVDRVDAELEELRRDMEQVQQQIWAAHAMIRQTTKDMDDLLHRAQEEPFLRVQPARLEPQPVAAEEKAAEPEVQPIIPQPQPVVEPVTEPAAEPVAVPAGEQPAADVSVQKNEAAQAQSAHRMEVPPRPRTTVTYTQPGRRVQRPAGGHPQPGYSTVRTTRETMADHLLDALARLWEKR